MTTAPREPRNKYSHCCSFAYSFPWRLDNKHNALAVYLSGSPHITLSAGPDKLSPHNHVPWILSRFFSEAFIVSSPPPSDILWCGHNNLQRQVLHIVWLELLSFDSNNPSDHCSRRCNQTFLLCSCPRIETAAYSIPSTQQPTTIVTRISAKCRYPIFKIPQFS